MPSEPAIPELLATILKWTQGDQFRLMCWALSYSRPIMTSVAVTTTTTLSASARPSPAGEPAVIAATIVVATSLTTTSRSLA